MNSAMEEAREQMVLTALSDKSSTFYQGMLKLLRSADANARRQKLIKKYVTVPFQVSEADLVELEEQFAVPLRVKGALMRASLSPRVAAVVHLLECALVEHAMAGGRTALIVDGDLMSVAAVGLDGKLVERTNALPRLVAGYFMEDEHLRRFASSVGTDIAMCSDRLRREQIDGGGEHFWPELRRDGPSVDVVVVNHFKTPVGPRQVADFAKCRQASVIGGFPFQVEMLYKTSGRFLVSLGGFMLMRTRMC